MVLMVWARSRDNVLKSRAVSEIVQCFGFKAVSEIVQCCCFKAVSEIVQGFCFKAVSEIVQYFLFIKQKAFVLDKGPLVEIPIVSFLLWA